MKTSNRIPMLLLLSSTAICRGQQPPVYPSCPPPKNAEMPFVVNDQRDDRNNWSVDFLKTGVSILIDLSDEPAAALVQLLGHRVPEDGKGIGVPHVARIIAIEGRKMVAEFLISSERDTDDGRIVSVTSKFLRQQVEAPAGIPMRGRYLVSESINGRRIKDVVNLYASLPRTRIDSFEGATIRVWKVEERITEFSADSRRTKE